jgi:hypothetical protein
MNIATRISRDFSCPFVGLALALYGILYGLVGIFIIIAAKSINLVNQGFRHFWNHYPAD